MKPGFVVIGPSGRVVVDAFESSGTTCREHNLIAMRWARDILTEAIRRSVEDEPSAGTALDACDLSDESLEALGGEYWLTVAGAHPL